MWKLVFCTWERGCYGCSSSPCCCWCCHGGWPGSSQPRPTYPCCWRSLRWLPSHPCRPARPTCHPRRSTGSPGRNSPSTNQSAKRKGKEKLLWRLTSVWSATAWWRSDSRGPAAVELSVAAAASEAFRLPAAFRAEPVPAAFPSWWAQRREPRTSLSSPPQGPAAGVPAAATSWLTPAADDTTAENGEG